MLLLILLNNPQNVPVLVTYVKYKKLGIKNTSPFKKLTINNLDKKSKIIKNKLTINIFFINKLYQKKIYYALTL